MANRSLYDPEWVEFEKNLPDPKERPADIFVQRAINDRSMLMMHPLLAPTAPGITTRDVQITPEVKVRIYHPPSAEGKTLPCVVFCHGGGWLSGNIDTEDHAARTVCEEAQCIVVSIDYRLAPEVQFPIPIDDCFTGFQWAFDNATSIGADKNRYILWGGSAGGGLAIAVAYRLVSSGLKDRIHGLVSMASLALHPDACPEQYKHLHRSYIENGGHIPVVTWDMCLGAYENINGLPPYNAERRTWFPLTLGPEALRDMPPTYIINTNLEAMRDDGTVLEAMLKDAGVEVRRDVINGQPHYFWIFPIEKASANFREKLFNGVKWLLRSGTAVL